MYLYRIRTLLRTSVLLALAVTAVGRLAHSQPAPAKVKPDAHFGNVLFKTPNSSVWKRSEEAGRLLFSAPVPPPDFCAITVFPGEKITGDFKSHFDAAVQDELKREGVIKIERDGGVQESQAKEGFPVLQRTIVCETKDFHTVHWFLAGNPGERFDMIAFQTSGEETYKLYGQDAVKFFTSVKLANSLEPGFQAKASESNSSKAPSRSPASRPPSGPGYMGFHVGDAVNVGIGGKQYPAWVVEISPSGGSLASIKVRYAPPGPYQGGELDNMEHWTGPGLLTHTAGRGSMPTRIAPRASGTAPGFKVGDAVEVITSGLWYPATILKIDPRGGENFSVQVHYTGRSPSGTKIDTWEAPDRLRHPKGAGNLSAGPKPGRYKIYSFAAGTTRLYLGYFDLSGSSYKSYSPGNRLLGSGSYSYDAGTHTLHWKGGPLAEYAPTADFSNEADGSTHQIRLRSGTIAVNEK